MRYSWVPERFKQLGKEYGRAGLFVYLGMSTTTFSILYVAIWNGVDVETVILDKIKALKEGMPIDIDSGNSDATTNEKTKEADTVEEKRKDMSAKGITMSRIGTTFLVAFAANKLLSPFKAMLTVFMTPYIVKLIRGKKLK